MPNSIIENLNRLQTAKEDIADAITENGGIIEQNDGLEEYPTRITNRFTEVNDTLSILLKGPTLITKSIIQNGTYSAEDDNADGYSEVTVTVPNSYSAQDEGKVVSSGALISQTAYSSTITENGTYDTTLNNSITVDVSSETNWLKTPTLGRCIPTCSKIKNVRMWTAKSWSGLTNFSGQYIWTDGENIYFSSGSEQYVLDKSTSTWSAKTWSSLASFDGYYVWTDGENIYYSSSSTQYVLDKSTSTWSTKSWSGFANVDGRYIWTDGENIYYSYGSNQYVLNKSTSTWSSKTWIGRSSFSGSVIWTDGENIYSSDSSNQYVLDKSTSTWTAKTWTGLSSLSGSNVWTDGENIYCISSSTDYVLNKSTSTWSKKTWTPISALPGSNVWTDGENIYYSSSSTQYVLDKATIYNNTFPTTPTCKAIASV